MASLLRRRSNLPVRRSQSDWSDPFERMREMLEWDPFGDLTRGWRGTWDGGSRTFSPAFNVRETKDGYVFTADVPGFDEGDIDIQLVGNRLTISGTREEEHSDQGDSYYVSERSSGSFTRTFTLPDGIDAKDVQAEMVKGVLTLTVPRPATAQATKIPLRGGKSDAKQLGIESKQRSAEPN